MEWYEILGLLILWVIVLIISVKISEWRKNYFRNGSWKDRKKR